MSHFQCIVCLEDQSDALLAKMPCCDRETSLNKYCAPCIKIIAGRGYGRCPSCRKYFRVVESNIEPCGISIQVVDNVDRCKVCCQLRIILERNTCDACVLGERHPLRYECDKCHFTQRIVHPMWRYQRTPGEFGEDTWACRACGDFTHWRVIVEDAHLVPAHDAPLTWGRGAEVLEEIRRLRRQQPVMRQAAFQVEQHGDFALFLFIVLIVVFGMIAKLSGYI